MKKLVTVFAVLFSLTLMGCFDTVQEITIAEDGSGTLATTNDMSAVIGMAKQFGGDEMQDIDKMVTDTVVMLDKMADSIQVLTAGEKELVKKGSLGIKMNMQEEIFTTRISYPFKSVNEIAALNKLTTRIMGDMMEKQMSAAENPMAANAPQPSSMDDYFDVNFSKGLITKTLNKEKYVNANNDEYLQGLLQTSSFGVPMKSSLVINLPHAAKNVTGKNVQLSADKKKITIETNIEDFFDSPDKLEFKIEY